MIQPEQFGLTFHVVLKWREIIYVEKYRKVALMAGLITEGSLKLEES